MRYIIKFSFPNDVGNAAVKDPQFGHKVQEYLTEIKAEAAYFCPVDGQRGGYFVVSFDDASKIAGTLEPLFMWLQADVELIPVMTMEDLQKAGPSIGAAINKWGK